MISKIFKFPLKITQSAIQNSQKYGTPTVYKYYTPAIFHTFSTIQTHHNPSKSFSNQNQSRINSNQPNNQTTFQKPVRKSANQLRNLQGVKKYANFNPNQQHSETIDVLCQKILENLAIELAEQKSGPYPNAKLIETINLDIFQLHAYIRKTPNQWPPSKVVGTFEDASNFITNMYTPAIFFKQDKTINDIQKFSITLFQYSKQFDQDFASQKFALFGQFIKSVSKLGPIHENIELWSLFQRIIESSLQKHENFEWQERQNSYYPILKALGEHLHYLSISKNNKLRAQMESIEGTAIQIIDKLLENPKDVKLRGLGNCLNAYRFLARSKAYSHLAEAIRQIVKDSKKYRETAHLLAKVLVFKKPEVSKNLVNEIKSIFIASSHKGLLSSLDYGIIILALPKAKIDQDFSDHVWIKFVEKLQETQEIKSTEFLEIISLVTQFITLGQLTPEKIIVIQDWLVNAFKIYQESDYLKELDIIQEQNPHPNNQTIPIFHYVIKLTELFYALRINDIYQDKRLDLATQFTAHILRYVKFLKRDMAPNLLQACLSTVSDLNNQSERIQNENQELLKNCLALIDQTLIYIKSNINKVTISQLVGIIDRSSKPVPYDSDKIVEICTMKIEQTLQQQKESDKSTSFTNAQLLTIFSHLNKLQISTDAMGELENKITLLMQETLPKESPYIISQICTFLPYQTDLRWHWNYTNSLEAAFIDKYLLMSTQQLIQAYFQLVRNTKIPQEIQIQIQNEILKDIKMLDNKQIHIFQQVLKISATPIHQTAYTTLEQEIEKRLNNFLKSTKLVKSAQTDELIKLIDSHCQTKIYTDSFQNVIEKFLIKYDSTFTLLQRCRVINILFNLKTKNLDLIHQSLKPLNQFLLEQEKQFSSQSSIKSELLTKALYQAYTAWYSYSEFKEYKGLEWLVNCNIPVRLDQRYMQLRSKYEKNVKLILNVAGFQYEEESRVGPYLVDFLLNDKIIMELNGQAHYVGNSTEHSLDFKRKIADLENLGYKVVIIPYYEWDIFTEDPIQQMAFLKKSFAEQGIDFAKSSSTE